MTPFLENENGVVSKETGERKGRRVLSGYEYRVNNSPTHIKAELSVIFFPDICLSIG